MGLTLREKELTMEHLYEDIMTLKKEKEKLAKENLKLGDHLTLCQMEK
jgi:hypothetical protein